MQTKNIKKIIINFPSNLGDAVLGLRVLDRLRANYPQAEISAIASPKTWDFLTRIDSLAKVVLFDKAWDKNKKLNFVLSLRGKYDLIADLKNSWLPIMLRIKNRTPFIRFKNKEEHVKDAYIRLVKKLAPKNEYLASNLKLTLEEEKKWDSFKFNQAIFIACSSRSSLKCYNREDLKILIDKLRIKYPVVIIGDNQDEEFYSNLEDSPGVYNLVGKTKLYEMFYLLKKYCQVFISVDSGLLHIASYLNLVIIALFGPTSSKHYGPWSAKSVVLKNENINCSPCWQAQCPKGKQVCMNIDPELIYITLEKLIN